ncbi:MerR family transcriptional regulator [Streptococcus mutans]|uniref:MerR family transcriptional regulator n=1 Tax=Streptococcus mutans TaxID=1309 RepID=UPI0022842098|nr:MerR family transcriptional regulator [Streptococcus mutans]MCY7125597.1 MerR family transcriptional regulator [Streptococcus mutans]
MDRQSEELLSISKFSKLANISRANLIFYDQKGILSPITRDEENSYRYYHPLQLNQAYTVSFLRRLGVPIRDIQAYFQHSQNPSAVKDLVNKQKSVIDREITNLENMRFNLAIYQSNLEDLEDRLIPSFAVEERSEVLIYISPLTSEVAERLQTMYAFFSYCQEQGVDYHGHSGRLFSVEKLDAIDIYRPAHIFFKHRLGNTSIPQGRYLVYYDYTDGSNLEKIYQSFLAYAKQERLELLDFIYEDYPLTGLVPFEEDRQLIRIMAKINDEL